MRVQEARQAVTEKVQAHLTDKAQNVAQIIDGKINQWFQFMEEIGDELASNMTETASVVHEISANIDGVKRQTLIQVASVTETAATIEEIVRTIKQLNNSIEIQAGSVAQSSA